MSKGLKDVDSLYTDQNDANFIFPVVNSSDEAGQENDKAGDNSYDEPVEQFVIFNPLSYCFEGTIGFDVKASFASRPVSLLIR